MRSVFAFLFVTVTLGGFCQSLDYASAPREALGYTFGATEASVVDGLKAANTPFRQDTTRQTLGVTTVTLNNQTLDKLDQATVELQFFKGALVQIKATVAYSSGAFKSLLAVLESKYGAKRSLDGGFHYNWFYQLAPRPQGNELPDFAIILASDAVDKKTVTLTYADNARRTNPAAATSTPVPLVPTPAPTPVPTLDPSHF